MTLDELNIHDTASVIDVKGEGLQHLKLLDSGLTRNTRLFVRNIAPTGDPMEIELRSYTLTLRCDEAMLIEVKKIDDEFASDVFSKEERSK